MQQPINILIVDDEPKNLIVLETILADGAYRLVRAESAEQALLALVAEEFALLILDIRMPGMTGFELAQMVKKRKRTAHVPIIFLTAYYNEDQHALEGYHTGAVDYLHKPINPAILRSKVAVFAELYRVQRESLAVNRALTAEVAERRRAEEQLRELNDTLDRRIAERTQALRDSEHFLQRVTEVMPGVLHVFDVETGQTVFLSRSFESLLGYGDPGAQPTDPRDVSSLMDPDDVPGFRAHVRQIGTHGDDEVTSIEYRMLDAAGEWRWFYRRDAAFARSPAGDVRQIIGTAIEITERKRAEQRSALHLGVARLLASTPTGDDVLPRLLAVIGETLDWEFGAVWLVDAAGGLYCRDIWHRPVRAIEPLITASRGARLEKGDDLPGRVWADGAEPLWIRAVSPHDSSPRVRLAREAGLGCVCAFPILLGGECLGVLEFFSRAIRESDNELRSLFGSIGTQVGQFVERTRVAEALLEADRRKDEFLATLAHELRNPLAPIRNVVQVLHMKGTATPELVWARDVIDRQTQQMARLIDDLMDVSRINRGRLELRREQVELKEIIHSAVESTRPLMEAAGHEVLVSLPPTSPVVNGDLTRLAQVLLNLLNNAAKYTDSGGRIELRAEQRGRSVLVSVSDTGIGIPEDRLSTIFDMFSQVEDALSRSRGGLGIGLFLVKRLVEMHGGSVEARSSGLGRGSEFTVHLPIAVEPAALLSITDVHKPTWTSALRVLVADDNRDAASTLSLMLEMMGNTVMTAHDGAEALTLAAQFQPRVVLLDIGLPHMNGYDVAQAIRQQPWGAKMVIVAITGWGQAEDRQRSKAAGVDHHMVKPVDPDALMQLLAGLENVSAASSSS
jgi:PAS domain S-box-containing protein